VSGVVEADQRRRAVVVAEGDRRQARTIGEQFHPSVSRCLDRGAHEPPDDERVRDQHNWPGFEFGGEVLERLGQRNLPGGDADSMGIFQQRPSQGWGTLDQLTPPAYQAGKFYDALLAIPNWQGLSLEQAAQEVQLSAYPSAYAKWITPAIALVDHFLATGGTPYTGALVSCADDCAAPATELSPSSVTSAGCLPTEAVLARAATWLAAWNSGPVPYSMSTNPADRFNGYRRDCSGHASMALGLPGPGLNTAGLAARSTPIPKTDLRPGDLLINPAPGGAGHVVIFDRWVEPGVTYLAYEQSGDGGTQHRVVDYPYGA
jgi:hypothetical protein